MSRYNYMNITKKCPLCNKLGIFEIFTYFGRLNCINFEIGDKVIWEKFNSVSKGGRPDNGDLLSLGWTECKNCECELDARIDIKNDIVCSVDIFNSNHSTDDEK